MKREEADAFLHQKVEDGELISPVLPDGGVVAVMVIYMMLMI